eukprot:UN20342
MSYQNAKFHSLSINNYKKIIDTQLRFKSNRWIPYYYLSWIHVARYIIRHEQCSIFWFPDIHDDARHVRHQLSTQDD